MSHHWEATTPNQAPPPIDLSGTFTIKAPPKTDIWRSTPEHNVFDAPAIITRLKASSFQSIEATFSGDWKTRYDQGGVLLVFPGNSDIEPKNAKSWIKAGIENEEGEAKLGIVGAHAYSDWSLAPTLDDSGSATIKFVRKGTALWIYVVHNGKDVGLREVTWAFLDERGGDAEIWVGVYAAKPTPDENSADAELEVTFKNVKLETS